MSTAWYVISSDRTSVKWFNLLHWPYTLWHLSYVVIGASITSTINWEVLIWMLVAFSLAMGVAAHSFDLVRGDPLKLALSTPKLAWVGGISLTLAAAIGLWQWYTGAIPPIGILFVAIGFLLVLGYNLEFWHMHGDWQFATWWAVFPILVGYFTQGMEWSWALIPILLFAFATAYAQRILSIKARYLRRDVIVAYLTVEERNTPGIENYKSKEWILSSYDLSLAFFNLAMVSIAIVLITR